MRVSCARVKETKMTNKDRKAAAALARAGEQSRKMYQDGKYTFVFIVSKVGTSTYQGFGFSSCSPKDKFSDDRGEQIAEGRALNMIAEQHLAATTGTVTVTILGLEGLAECGQKLWTAVEQAMVSFGQVPENMKMKDLMQVADVRMRPATSKARVGVANIITEEPLAEVSPADDQGEQEFLETWLRQAILHGYGVQPPLPGIRDGFIVTPPAGVLQQR